MRYIRIMKHIILLLTLVLTGCAETAVRQPPILDEDTFVERTNAVLIRSNGPNHVYSYMSPPTGDTCTLTFRNHVSRYWASCVQTEVSQVIATQERDYRYSMGAALQHLTQGTNGPAPMQISTPQQKHCTSHQNAFGGTVTDCQ